MSQICSKFNKIRRNLSYEMQTFATLCESVQRSFESIFIRAGGGGEKGASFVQYINVRTNILRINQKKFCAELTIMNSRNYEKVPFCESFSFF
jgi:hypothetical protein